MTLEDEFIDLIDQYGDLVDIYYTQFLEVAFYLKVAADQEMAVGFIKKKLPQLSTIDIHNLITEIVSGHQELL